MRRLICILLVAIVQLNAEGAETEQLLKRLENDFAQALVRRDTATFERLLAPRFVYTEDASMMNKAELIRAIMADKITSASNDDMKVHLYGDTAVVTGILHTTGSGKEGKFDRRYRFTDTWLFRENRWQIIAAQDYLIKK